ARVESHLVTCFPPGPTFHWPRPVAAQEEGGGKTVSALQGGSMVLGRAMYMVSAENGGRREK
ncbi:Hypothetical predicted protein, partial [Pelobates cultripes]